jgi:hypothetical protein
MVAHGLYAGELEFDSDAPNDAVWPTGDRGIQIAAVLTLSTVNRRSRMAASASMAGKES